MEKLIENEVTERCAEVEISWSEIYFTIETKTSRVEVLKGVSGRARPGEFLAIMGSSGAGKTTLLNILSDRVQRNKNIRFSGVVTANEQSIYEISYNNYIGYVTQEDILIESLTVKESLMFSARLRLSGTFQSIETKVENLLTELKLQNCKNTFVGSEHMKGISGGEKKRTSIGIELITDPAVLFLDEPTSGLDSFTANVVINLLVSQSKKGRSIISTIHQPSSDIFQMFDKLMLMSDGHIVYHGKASACRQYFENLNFICPEFSNPADYFIEILHIQRPHQLTEAERKTVYIFSEAYNKNQLKSESVIFEVKPLETNRILRKTSFLFQLYLNFIRFWKRTVRNPMLFYIKVFIMSFVALIIDLFYYQIGKDGISNVRDRNGVLFFVVINLIFANLQGSVLSFPVMRSLLIKEYNSNMYGVTPFFISKCLIDLIFDIFITCWFGCLIYWAVGLNSGSMNVLTFFFVCLGTHMAGGSLGFFVGSLFKRMDVAMSFTAFIILPFLYFSGYYRNDNIPVAFRWIENTSVIKYAFQALAKNEYDGLGAYYCTFSTTSHQELCPPQYWTKSIDSLSITMPLHESIMWLFVIMIFIRILVLVILQVLVKTNKA